MRLTGLLTVVPALVIGLYGTAHAGEKAACDPIAEVLENQDTTACSSAQNAKVPDADDASSVEPVSVSDDAVEDDESPRGRSGPIPDKIWKAMQGKSWHRNSRCPPRKRLSLLEVPHWAFTGERKIGQLIVARDAAEKILDVFAELYRVGFPIERMELVHTFNGKDARSMAANNTSAFNCRLKSSGSSLSEHSYGRAIDINPVQNPYVTRRGGVQPRAGRAFKKGRHRKRRGMIRKGDVVVKAFRKIGWKWGGYWRSAKDYQHFSQSGK